MFSFYWKMGTIMEWMKLVYSLQWRHNEHDGISNHWHLDCLHNRLFRCRSKKTWKPRITGLCVANSQVTGEFPAQRTSNTENVAIWWRHHKLGPRACEALSSWSQNVELFVSTRVKQCTFHWLISNDIAQKEMVLSSSVIQPLIIITCISYEIVFTISLPKLINIAPLKTYVTRVTDAIRHCNTDYSGLEWKNFNAFWC